jgi:hypothetical protein
VVRGMWYLTFVCTVQYLLLQKYLAGVGYVRKVHACPTPTVCTVLYRSTVHSCVSGSQGTQHPSAQSYRVTSSSNSLAQPGCGRVPQQASSRSSLQVFLQVFCCREPGSNGYAYPLRCEASCATTTLRGTLELNQSACHSFRKCFRACVLAYCSFELSLIARCTRHRGKRQLITERAIRPDWPRLARPREGNRTAIHTTHALAPNRPAETVALPRNSSTPPLPKQGNPGELLAGLLACLLGLVWSPIAHARFVRDE